MREVRALIFRAHAILRMFSRGVGADEVRQVLESGEIIEEYPEDQPYPSRLVLGWCGDRPLHVVVAENADGGETIVITVYEPTPERWEAGFRQRKERP